MSATAVNILNTGLCEWEMSKPYHVIKPETENTKPADRTYYEHLQKLYLIHNC